MDTTQAFSLIFILCWAVVLLWIGYRYGHIDGQEKGKQLALADQEESFNELSRKLGEARLLNRRLLDHFDILEARLLNLEAPLEKASVHPLIGRAS
ncbi:hypothetical protein [Pseudomonas syringae]|uniref:Uncharacterized protein n=1 Tax=Pseudomonas syringae CC1417 TaxID=1357272 RepID=A0AAU8LGH4_PSESX